MTNAQRISLMADWWPAACEAQGWQKSDRELRLRVLSVAVSLDLHSSNVADILHAIRADVPLSRTITSANDLGTGADVDAVKACLGLLSDNLASAREVGNPELGEARRLVWQIRKMANAPYWQKIARDKFHTDDLGQLAVEQLTQLRNTLAARISARRSKQPRQPATEPF